jgi:hypothetical protein
MVVVEGWGMVKGMKTKWEVGVEFQLYKMKKLGERFTKT